MKKISRNAVRGMAMVGALLVGMGSTAAYAGGSTSTKLDNGRLYFEAHNGREIGQSSSKVYAGAKYTKTGGSGTVYAQLRVSFDKGLYKDTEKAVKKGHSIKYSLSVPVSVASDCSAVGVMISGGKFYETPYIDHLC
ncbi:hypothetical protein [Streptomyces caniferus]|uniref:hypothetical protein n=1 Tax=Streptomyces caniferus TaxID=285557 RepID=UPI00381254AB